MYIVDRYYGMLNKCDARNSRFYALLYKILKVLLNLAFPIVCRNKEPMHGQETDIEVIVSFTSFPARIDTVWETAFTLLNQTRRASKVILWLANDQFKAKKELPPNLLKLENYGLEIRFCEDLRSHKKYYYTMKEYPDAIVVTADDDVFYPSNWLEKMLEKHSEFPDSVICYWAHRITFENGKILPYEKWNSCVMDGDKNPTNTLMPVGYGGVLYPPNCLDKRLFDKELIRRLCITADDLWLKAMAYLQGYPSVQVEREPVRFFSVLRAQEVSLSDVNNGENKNNEAMEQIMENIPELSLFR